MTATGIPVIDDEILRDEHVQVVLTDLRMPGLGGLAVLRHVREFGADAEVDRDRLRLPPAILWTMEKRKVEPIARPIATEPG